MTANKDNLYTALVSFVSLNNTRPSISVSNDIGEICKQRVDNTWVL